MNRARLLSLLVALAVAAPAWAVIDMSEIDPRTRARIAREKLRASAMERLGGDAGASGASRRSASCGSQEIGVIETHGRNGPAPREVFVYAPNAINIVSAKCPR